MGEMDEIINEFLIEGDGHLDSLDNDFVALEKNPTDRALLSSIFRSIHTIKGGAGLFNFSNLEKLTHVAESLLVLLRDGKLLINTEITTVLLETVDAVRTMLGSIKKSGGDGNTFYPEIIEKLSKFYKRDEAGASVTGPHTETLPSSSTPATPSPSQPQGQIAPQAPSHTQPQHPQGVSEIAEPSTLGTETSIRVDVRLLDKLMTLVEELVLSRNQIVQFATNKSTSNEGESGLMNATQRLDLITSELQEGIMKTRMQPIGGVWNKFPRIIRDLATVCKKKIRLEMIGEDTELDRTLLEAIKDPLTHIVRNSVDHGIEEPAVRKAKGKPEEGTMTMKAYHEGGQVNIEISDDGGGIIPSKIRDKALSKGLITADAASQMSDRELRELIFLPGFSTAEKVTNVSGRGVGMDVVKTNIEKANGTVEIDSIENVGTTLKLKIPLTLAIIPALIVVSKDDHYAIPQVNLLELVRIDRSDVKKQIQLVHGAPVYQLRGNLLPLIYLNEVLELESERKEDSPENQSESKSVNIVVLKAGERRFGLVVEEVRDTQEIVVKPLNKLLRHISVFAGATIMGDGKVALILDVVGLAQKAKLLKQELETRDTKTEAQSAEQGKGQKSMFLLFRTGTSSNMAIPMSQVERIEEIESSKLEKAGEKTIIQYRGKIMPLISIASALLGKTNAAFTSDLKKDQNSTIQFVVYSRNDKSIGFAVDQVYDVIEEKISLDSSIRRHGVLGSAIIQQKVTEIINIDEIVTQALPDWTNA